MKQGGCFNDCYAAKSAKLYGYDFSKTVLRDFENKKHRLKILAEINNSKLDFIRIGTSGDPSENWEHCIKILKQIECCNKEIVIITKHWANLSKEQIEYLGTINVCVNTSVSALDKEHIYLNGVEQYKRLKLYCKSILRIVSADFNLGNEIGHRLHVLQKRLFENTDTLDTVLRVNKNNPLVKNEIINIKKTKFLGKNAIVSKYNPKTYFGKCSSCQEMCGATMSVKDKQYPNKVGISKQSILFKK